LRIKHFLLFIAAVSLAVVLSCTHINNKKLVNLARMYVEMNQPLDAAFYYCATAQDQEAAEKYEKAAENYVNAAFYSVAAHSINSSLELYGDAVRMYKKINNHQAAIYYESIINEIIKEMGEKPTCSNNKAPPSGAFFNRPRLNS